MKKKILVAAAFASATLFSYPVIAAPQISICDIPATSFEIWFIQQFYC